MPHFLSPLSTICQSSQWADHSPCVPWGPHRERCLSLELTEVPGRWAPYQAPQQGPLPQAPLPQADWGPPSSLIISCKCTLSPGFPTGPLQRETPISGNSSFPQSPGKETPSTLPNRVPMERENLSPKPMVTHSLKSIGVPERRSPPTKCGKNVRSLSTKPHVDGRPMYNGLVHQGIINNTGITIPVPCSPWHDTFHLGLARPEPH
jgi:hypothetical protein